MTTTRLYLASKIMTNSFLALLALTIWLGTDLLGAVDDSIAVRADNGHRTALPRSLAKPLPAQKDNRRYYVDPKGNDNNPGSLALPFATIQRAVDMAQAGDMVYVRGGTYHETVKITRSGRVGQPITLAAYPGERPVIDGQYQLPDDSDAGCDPETGNCFNYGALISIEGGYIVFDGFEVTRSRGRGIRIWPNGHATVKNCWVHDVRESGILVFHSEHNILENNRVWLAGDFAPYPRSHNFVNWPGGLAIRRGHHTIVRGNEVFNNWGEGIVPMETHRIVLEGNTVYNNFAVNIYMDHVSDILITRNLVYHTGEGPFLRGGNPSSGIVFATEPLDLGHPSGNQIVTNNVLVGNRQNIAWWGRPDDRGGLVDAVIANNTLINAGQASLQIDGNRHHRNVRIQNNLFLQNGGDLVVVPDSEMRFSHNLWSRTPPAYAASAGDVIADPLLVNPYAPLVQGDVQASWYRPTMASPAVGAAAIVPEAGRDFAGSFRGMDPDIGAYEIIRIPNGLQALYTFEGRRRELVPDVSGVGMELDLAIEPGTDSSWLPSALAIHSPTVISSQGPATKIANACRASNEVTVEAWIRPAQSQEAHPAQIVAIAQDIQNFNVMLGQGSLHSQRSDLYSAWLTTSEQSADGQSSLASPPGSVQAKLTHLVYTRSASGLAQIYIDNKVAASGLTAGNLSYWDDTFPLVLGNEAAEQHPWLGELHLVAIYCRALSESEVDQNYVVGPSPGSPFKSFLPSIFRLP